MSLTDRLKSPCAPAMHGLPCSIGTLLGTLPPAEAKALQAMLDDRAWSQNMIWEALRAEGHEAGRQSVNRHRSGRCRCARGKP